MDCPAAPLPVLLGRLRIPAPGRRAPSRPAPARAGWPDGPGAVPHSCCGVIATWWWPSAWEPRCWWPSACYAPAPNAGSRYWSPLDQHASGRRPPPVPVDLHPAGGGEPGSHLPGEGHGADGLDDQRLPDPAAGSRGATGPGAHRRRRRAGPPRRAGGHHRTGSRGLDTTGAGRDPSGRDGAESRRAARGLQHTEEPGEQLDNESLDRLRHPFFTNRPGITRISGVFSEHFPRNTCGAFRNSQHSSLFWSPSSDDSAGRRR